MSMDASGSLGKTIVFSKWKGRHVIRIHAIPSNPRTAGQISTRAMMRFLSTIWATIGTTFQATWDDLAKAGNFSPFNAFVQHNLKLWTQFQSPLIAMAGAGNVAPVLGASAATGEVGQASFAQTITTQNDGWEWELYMNKTTGFTPARNDLVYTKQMGGDGAIDVVVVTNLTPGTYFFVTRGVTEAGSPTAFTTEKSAVVT